MLKIIRTDSAFKILCLGCGTLALLLILGLFVQLAISSGDAWKTYGLEFLVSTAWDPVKDEYGALPAILGTLVTSAIAMAIALPLAFCTAIYLVDAPPAVRRILSQITDLLAAIPSVIFGMWGIFVLAPIMQKHIQPLLIDSLHLDALPWIEGDCNGFGLLTSGVVLSVMILPYVCAVFRDVLSATPAVLKEAAYGIGCTRFEVSKDILLRYGIQGLMGGVFIGLGRALGETMAVLFVIGNVMEMPHNLLGAGTTISSALANNFAEADGVQRSVLFAMGLVLLLMCLGIQILFQAYLRLGARKRGES